MTNDELKDIFKYLDSFCVVNLMLIRANPNTISLDEVIFQDNKKIKIQTLLNEIQVCFNLDIKTSITVIEAFMIRTILLSTSYVDSKDIMLDFVERFIVWLRQFDGGNSYNDIYVMEYNIKSVNRPTSRFRKSIRYY